MNEYYMAHIGEDKCMDDPYAHWLMGTYQVETNPSVQTMETSIGATRC
jgi:hypothetical protein